MYPSICWLQLQQIISLSATTPRRHPAQNDYSGSQPQRVAAESAPLPSTTALITLVTQRNYFGWWFYRFRTTNRRRHVIWKWRRRLVGKARVCRSGRIESCTRSYCRLLHGFTIYNQFCAIEMSSSSITSITSPSSSVKRK